MDKYGQLLCNYIGKFKEILCLWLRLEKEHLRSQNIQLLALLFRPLSTSIFDTVNKITLFFKTTKTLQKMTCIFCKIAQGLLWGENYNFVVLLFYFGLPMAPGTDAWEYAQVLSINYLIHKTFGSQ